MSVISRLHHAAYRCRDSEETRRFYEDFLGLPLVQAFEILETKTGRKTHVLHTFYALDDGSCIAFFDDPETPFDFKQQRDYDLHIALCVPPETLQAVLERARAAGIEARGISDHVVFQSLYLRDPNGYVVELATAISGELSDAKARDRLAAWQRNKSR